MERSTVDTEMSPKPSRKPISSPLASRLFNSKRTSPASRVRPSEAMEPVIAVATELTAAMAPVPSAMQARKI
ncbi:hypothetical protein D3C87_2173160 [compost metagenome]